MAESSPLIEEPLCLDQCRFTAERSCCGLVLHLMQFIEDGYEAGKIIGAVLVDLTAAHTTQ